MPQNINRIRLFDRPNLSDEVTVGLLTFSDGTVLPVGALSAGGTDVRFATKTSPNPPSRQNLPKSLWSAHNIKSIQA
jgi:hypothetical protein